MLKSFNNSFDLHILFSILYKSIKLTSISIHIFDQFVIVDLPSNYFLSVITNIGANKLIENQYLPRCYLNNNLWASKTDENRWQQQYEEEHFNLGLSLKYELIEYPRIKKRSFLHTHTHFTG